MSVAAPGKSGWADAFRFLSEHPRTPQMTAETFQDNL
jgi:hypothetical protein